MRCKSLLVIAVAFLFLVAARFSDGAGVGKKRKKASKGTIAQKKMIRREWRREWREMLKPSRRKGFFAANAFGGGDDGAQPHSCLRLNRIVNSHTNTSWRSFRKFWVLAADAAAASSGSDGSGGSEYFMKIFPERRRYTEVVSQVVAFYLSQLFGYDGGPGARMVPATGVVAFTDAADIRARFAAVRRTVAFPGCDAACEEENVKHNAWVDTQVQAVVDELRTGRGHDDVGVDVSADDGDLGDAGWGDGSGDGDAGVLYGIIQEKISPVVLLSSTASKKRYCGSMCEQCNTLLIDYFIGNFDRASNCFVRVDGGGDARLVQLDNEGYFSYKNLVYPYKHHVYSNDTLAELMFDAKKLSKDKCRFAPHVVSTLVHTNVADVVGARFARELATCGGGAGSVPTRMAAALELAVYAIRRRQKVLMKYLRACQKSGLLAWNERRAHRALNDGDDDVAAEVATFTANLAAANAAAAAAAATYAKPIDHLVQHTGGGVGVDMN
jgi:hypothetical protein